MSGKLDRLPGWDRQLDQQIAAGLWSTHGLFALLDDPERARRFGEWWAANKVEHDRLIDDLVAGRLVYREEPVATAPVVEAPTIPFLSLSAKGELLIRGLNPRTFWSCVFRLDDWTGLHIPKFPALAPATAPACVDFGLMPIFCPAGTLIRATDSGHRDRYILPDWNKFLTYSDIIRCPLRGRWILVETIRKPDWNDSVGYGPDDKARKLLDLQRRFGTSWDALHDGRMTKLADAWGLSSGAVRLPTAEEMNWVGNLFLLANRVMGIDYRRLPNLGSTKSWEWCENSYGSDSHLVFGDSENGGLAAVDGGWHDLERDYIGFRVLAVLSS